MRGRKRRRGGSSSSGGGGSGGGRSAPEDADAGNDQQQLGRAYDRLLGHIARTPAAGTGRASAGQTTDEQADRDAARRVASAKATAAKVTADDELADENEEDDDEAEAKAGSDDDENDEAEDNVQWRSAAYDAHYDKEWPPAELDARHNSWRDEQWQLSGLGDARATTVPSVAAPKGGSGGSAEAFLRRCGVLPPLRAAWRKTHGDGPLTDAQAALLALLMASRVDVLAGATPLDAYFGAEGLLQVLALHAAQHIIVTQKMRERHKRKGLTPQDRGFTRPSVLVLLPFRALALNFVQELLALLPPCYEQYAESARATAPKPGALGPLAWLACVSARRLGHTCARGGSPTPCIALILL